MMSVAAQLIGPQKPNYYEISDHLIVGTTTSGALGELSWTTNDSVSGGAITKQNAAGHPGIYQLDSGATAGNMRCMYLTNLGNIDTSETFENGWIFNLPAVTAASELIRIGMLNATVANPNYGIYLEKVAAETNWRTNVNFSGTANNPDTGVAVATGWHSLLMRKWSQTLVPIICNTALTHDWPAGTVITNTTRGQTATTVTRVASGQTTLHVAGTSVASTWQFGDAITIGSGGSAESKTLNGAPNAALTPTVLFRLDSGPDIVQTDFITASVGLIPNVQIGNGSAAASRLLQVDYFRLRLQNVASV